MYNCSETLCSLQFAKRCRSVELGAAKKNSDSAEVLRLRKMVRALQEDIQAIQADDDDDTASVGSVESPGGGSSRFAAAQRNSRNSRSLGPSATARARGQLNGPTKTHQQ